MVCKICGKKTRIIIQGMCPDCYIDTNLPTKISNRPWVYAENLSVRRFRTKNRDDEEPELKSIPRFRLSKDKVSIVISSVSIPLTVENVDKLAKETSLLVGKWLVYRDASEINNAWKLIAKAVFNGELGMSAKVSTTRQGKERYVICAYTYDYLDLDDVKGVREKLRDLGFEESLCYKPDICTYLGIYYKTTPLSPCRYRE